MSLPDGVEVRQFDDRALPATTGDPIGDEPVLDGWRAWDPNRSKVAAMLDRGMNTGLDDGQTVLYLGAAAGTTVSHIADFAGPTYAVEFAARPMRDLLTVAKDRQNLVPLLKDARRPTTYAHVVEGDVDVLIQDIATRDQATVANRNRQFVRDGGRLILAVKARSEDVTADPERVFDAVQSDLAETYEVLESARLSPRHGDHQAIVATPR